LTSTWASAHHGAVFIGSTCSSGSKKCYLLHEPSGEVLHRLVKFSENGPAIQRESGKECSVLPNQSKLMVNQIKGSEGIQNPQREKTLSIKHPQSKLNKNQPTQHLRNKRTGERDRCQACDTSELMTERVHR